MELRAKYTILAEGARGSLTKQTIDRYALNKDSDHQKYGLGVKELWQVRPEVFRSGLVQHSMGWPLPNKAGGGSWLYHFDDHLVSVGFVVHLNYENPTLSPFEEFQRFKTHPMIRDVFEGGKRIGYGARAIMEGGWQSVPRLSFPGGCLVGDSAGFVNVPRIKGSHNAILSGMLCAEHVFDALQAGRANDEVSSYEEAWRSSARSATTSSVCATSSRCGRKYGTLVGIGLGGIDMWLNELTGYSLFGTLKHGKPDHETLKPLDQVKPIVYPEAGRGADLRPAVVGVPVEHEPRGGPAEPPQGEGHGAAEALRARVLRRPLATLLPSGGVRVGGGRGRRALPDQRPELRSLQDVRYQGPEPEHRLGHARRRRRAELH